LAKGFPQVFSTDYCDDRKHQMKPKIGITTFYERRPHKRYCMVSDHYVRSVRMAGGLPVLLPISPDVEDAAASLDGLDGVLFSGGEDVSPLLYGESPVKEVRDICPHRDAFEMALAREAMRRDMPVLGICRGMQVMNVAAGGTLYQDVFSQITDCLGHLPMKMAVESLYHTVSINPGTKLSAMFEEEPLAVNSFHHQAVKEVGDGFIPTAFSTGDGVIEAIENPGKKFCMAVQWHAEDLTVDHPHFLRLFSALVGATS